MFLFSGVFFLPGGFAEAGLSPGESSQSNASRRVICLRRDFEYP
jgi:hypothetical protein